MHRPQRFYSRQRAMLGKRQTVVAATKLAVPGDAAESACNFVIETSPVERIIGLS
jgi:hypothetical protein